MDTTKTAEKATTVIVETQRLQQLIWDLSDISSTLSDLESQVYSVYNELTELKDGNIR